VKLGTPIYKRSTDSRWYYWINGKQGHCSGDVLSPNRLGAKREIRATHPGCQFDAVIHEDEYHARGAMYAT